MTKLPDTLFVNCPTCQRSLIWSTQNDYRPFCSKRCQLIDFGEWATEKLIITLDNTTPSTDCDEL